jgi:rhodanese-related sulfurtransferase
MKTVTVRELHDFSRMKPVEVIDVRTVEEFRAVHAAIARHVPMDTIEPHELMRSRTLSGDEPMYFLCHVGGRSSWVCRALSEAGYGNVVNVEGGMDAWEAAGLPVERG